MADGMKHGASERWFWARSMVCVESWCFSMQPATRVILATSRWRGSDYHRVRVIQHISLNGLRHRVASDCFDFAFVFVWNQNEFGNHLLWLEAMPSNQMKQIKVGRF